MSDPVADLKRELVAAAERQQRDAAVRAGGLRWWSRLARNRVIAILVTMAIAAAASLVAATPWSTSSTFLARAEAALTPPAGAVLHQKWVVTTTSHEFGCTVTHAPNESWIDGTAPHRYRVVLNAPPPPKVWNLPPPALACWKGTGIELGGVLDRGETLELVSRKRLAAAPRLSLSIDPVAQLREELVAGSAHDDGTATLDGRTVQRIRIDPDSECRSMPDCPDRPFYWYVDPETFRPVVMAGPGGLRHPSRPFVELGVVVRVLAYEYLPRTPDNLALTDIRAQHPDATGP